MRRSPLHVRPSWLAGASRRRRLTTVAGSIGAAAVMIGIVVAELPGSSQGASTAPAVAGATTVQRRDLVATDTVSGTLSYAKAQTVFNRLTGTVTSLPSVGQVIASGQTLYRVSGNPVVLFNGAVPAYRDLTAGDTNGADILELNRALRALGFDTGHQIALNDTWQAATTTAVERWQGSVGETETGTITLGQIVFLPGTQRITTLDTVLGSTGGASGSSGTGTSTTGAAYTGPAPRAQFVSLTTTPSTPATTATSTTSATATATATSPATSTTPAKSPGACTSVGMGVQPGAGTGATNSPTTTPSPTPTTTTPSSTPTCSSPGSSKSGGRAPSTAAQLLALLKAETQELKQSLTGSSGSSGASGRGGTASPSGAGTGSTGSTGSASGASTGGAGAPSSAGSAGAARSSASSAGASSSSGSTGSASGTGSAGGTGGSGTAQAILQTTSNQLQVTVNLDATKQSEAVVGQPVTVQLPSGTTVDGKITAVSPVAQSSSSSSSSGSGSGASSSSSSGGSSSTPSSTIPVAIRVTGRHPLSGLDQAAVSVNFQQQMEKNVMSVPVSALLATAGGGYAVQEAARPHRLIAVTPGLFAAGYVQISGAQLFPGLQVTDSQG